MENLELVAARVGEFIAFYKFNVFQEAGPDGVKVFGQVYINKAMELPVQITITIKSDD